MKCSPLGIGNDYGGSVRIPAHCCGLTALLTSTDRVIVNQAITYVLRYKVNIRKLLMGKISLKI